MMSLIKWNHGYLNILACLEKIDCSTIYYDDDLDHKQYARNIISDTYIDNEDNEIIFAIHLNENYGLLMDDNGLIYLNKISNPSTLDSDYLLNNINNIPIT